VIKCLSISVALGIIVGFIDYCGFSWLFTNFIGNTFVAFILAFPLSLIGGFFAFEKTLEWSLGGDNL
jgi:hypothetical protein